MGAVVRRMMMKLLIASCLVALAASTGCDKSWGYTNKQPAQDTKCTGGATTCSKTACCSTDPKSCKSAGVVCGAGKFADSSKSGKAAGTTQAEKVKNCCSAQATCADVKCAAGTVAAHTTPKNQKCTSSVKSCAGCCKAKTGTCGAEATNICASGTYK